MREAILDNAVTLPLRADASRTVLRRCFEAIHTFRSQRLRHQHRKRPPNMQPHNASPFRAWLLLHIVLHIGLFVLALRIAVGSRYL